MRQFALIGLTVATVLGCASAFPEREAENARIESCKAAIPILRYEPAWPYRVLQVIEASDETELAWYACAERADAVISTFAQEEETKFAFGGWPHTIAGKAKTRTKAKFIGRAIRYDRIPAVSQPTRQRQ